MSITQENWEYEVNRTKEMLEVYKTIPLGFSERHI